MDGETIQQIVGTIVGGLVTLGMFYYLYKMSKD